MNIPAYQKKDYSYFPNAFQQASQGFGQITQGISQAMDIGDRERKRAREEELLADLKIQRKDAEKVRETAISELASEIHEAMGLPNDEAGYGRALDTAMQYYQPFFGNEKQDPGIGIKRLWDQEQKKDTFLNNIKMKRFREEFNKGTVEEPVPQTAPIQEPVGTVGVEDQGMVKKPLSTSPESLPQMQQQVTQDSLSQEPAPLKTLSRERTADDFYKLGTQLGITQMPEFKELVGYLGRKEVTEAPREEPTYQGPVLREALSKPVVTPEAEKFAQTYPKEMTEKEKLQLEYEKIRALKSANNSDDVDKNIREATKRYDKLSSEVLKYTEKVNRLRQARVKLNAGKSLDEKLRAAISGVVSNPDNPDINEIDSEIDRLLTYTESLKGTRKEAQSVISDLSSGKTLPQATKELDVKKQKIAQEAYQHIQTKIKPVSSQFTSTSQIINMLPTMYRKAIAEKVDEMRARGIEDKRIADMLLGR